MDEHKLICLVQNRDELYNKMSSGFKDKAKKKNLWVEISSEMGVPAAICERRWTSLRDRFNKELQKVNGPSGSGAIVQSDWPYFDSMSFLRGHILQRQPRSNFNIQPPQTVPEVNTWQDTSFEDCIIETVEVLDTDMSNSYSTNCASTSMGYSLPPSPAPASSQAQSRARKRRMQSSDDSMAEATSAFLSYVKQADAVNPMASACGTMVSTALSAMPAPRMMEKIVEITKLLHEWSKEPQE